MPEAWAIEVGDDGVIIVIHDNGTMVDTLTSPWSIHPDIAHLWNGLEDQSPFFELSWADVDFVDDDGDGHKDNVIGYNFAPGFVGDTTAAGEYSPSLAWWHSMPNDFHLCDNVIVKGKRLAEEFKSWDALGYSDHGVRVASIAAAKLSSNHPGGTRDIVGVAFGCMVYWVRAGNYLGGPLFDEVQALVHGADVGSIINMSWGFPNPTEAEVEELSQAITYATDEKDCVLVASVGNNGSDDFVLFPAKSPDVLSVGSVEISGDSLIHSSYSNYDKDASRVDVVAPVAYIEGNLTNRHTAAVGLCGDCPPCEIDIFVDYSSFGTSFAAPQATGIAALIRSRFPSMSQDSVRARIKRAAEYFWTPADSFKYGAGKVNGYRALTEWGEIANSTTWNATDTRDSTFYLSGDLVIASGVTLTINAGTKIKIAPDHEQNQSIGNDADRVEIIVEGSLVVAGTSGEPVVFESFTDSPSAAGDWVGIRFESTSQDNELSHVIIKHAVKGIENYAPVTIANAVIDSCGTGIEAHAALPGIAGQVGATISHAGWGILSFADITLDGYTITDCIEGVETHDDLVVENSTLSGHSAFGVDIVAGTTTFDDVTIIGCATGANVNGQSATLVCGGSTIRDCTYRGISASSSGDTVLVSNTSLRENYEGIFVGGGAYAELDTCSLVANDTGVSSATGSHADVRNCLVDSSTTNGVYCLLSNNVTISATTLSYGAVGLFCYVNSSPTINGASWVKQNTTGIKCDYYCSPTIRSTKITGSTTGVMAFEGSTPDLDGSCGTPCNGNSIHHNTAADVANFDTLVTVPARCVYWGSSSGPDPGSFVGSVDYVPYCSDNPLPSSPRPPGDDEKPDAEFPVSYNLSCNYPNPFNPATRLKYEVPQPGARVEIAVFDVRGRLVKTLVSEPTSPGVYTVLWDGVDEKGANASSGVYFVRMTAGSFGETRKLVLLK